MRRTLILAVIGLVVMLVVTAFAASSGHPAESGHRPSSADCGLHRPNRELDRGALPAIARLTGAEVVSAESSRGFVSGLLNAPMSVAGLTDSMHSRLLNAGYAIIYEDFEGFEAEIFVDTEDGTGVIRILASRCPDFSSLSFQLPEAN